MEHARDCDNNILLGLRFLRSGLCVLLMLAAGAEGATLTWTGAAGDGATATAGNWSPAQAPVAGDLLIYSGATSLAPQLAAGLAAGSISFDSTAGAFVLGGPGVYTLGAAGITNNSTNLETVSNSLILSATQTWSATTGALTMTGAVATAGKALTVSGSFNTILQGVVSDTGTMTKSGTGTLTLSGINTLTGATTLTAGTLVIGNNAAFGTGTLSLKGGTIQGDAARTVANAISLGASTSVAGASNLIFNGSLLQSGGSRTLTVNNTGTTALAGGIQLTDSGTVRTLTITGTGAVVVSGVIIDGVAAGSITKSGTGTLTLSAANTYTGTTALSAGTLILGNNSAAGRGVLSLGTATLQSSISGLTLANNVTLAGTTIFSGSNDITFSGIVTGTGSRTLTFSSTALATFAGTFNLSSSLTARTQILAGTGNVTISSVIQNGSTATTGNLTMSGTGILTLTGASGNTYTGTTTVNDGTLVLSKSSGNAIAGALTIGSGTGVDTVRLTNADQIGDTSAVTVNATGVLNLNANHEAIGSLAGAGAVQLGTGGALIVGSKNTATTFSGIISGAGSLLKTGTAAQTLSGSNSYTGTTTIEAGTLTLGKANAIAAASAVTVTGSTSILNLGAFAETLSSLTLVVGRVTGTGLLTLTGDVTATSSGGTASSISGPVALSGVRTFTVNAGGATSDLNMTGIISSSGSLVKAGGGAMTLGGANTYTGSTTVNAGALRISSGTAIADASTVTLADVAGASLVVVSATETIGSLAGGGTTGGNVTLGTGALTVGGAASNTYAGTISGAGGITKAGTGTQTLTGTNVYAGATTINAGTLRATGGAAIPDASAVVTANVASAVLDLGGSSETIGSLAGGGTLGGGVTLGAGALSVGANNSSTSYAGVISGTGGVTKVGSGTQTFTAAHTFSGALAVTGGTLTLAGATGTAASATSVNLGTGGTLLLDNSVTENVNRLASGVAITLNGGTLSFISDATGSSENFGSLVPASGASTVTMTHNGTAGTASIIQFSSLGSIGNGATVNFIATGGTLGAAATGPQIYLTGQSVGFIGGWATVGTNFAEYSTFGVRALAGYYAGANGVNVNDPAQLVLLVSTSPASAYTLTNAGTTTDSGLNLTDLTMLDLGADSANVLNLASGGLLKSTAINTTISGQGRLASNGTASGTLSVTVVSTGTLTIASSVINNAGADGVYGNSDDGVVTLSKGGTGMLILTGTNSFTGNLVLNGGVVQAGAQANLGDSSSDVIFNNGTLILTSGFNVSTDKAFLVSSGLSGTLDIASGQTLTLGNASNVLTTGDATGTLYKKGAGALVIQAANPNFDGKLQIDAGTVELRDAQALGDATNRGTITLNGGTLILRGDASLNFANAVTMLTDSTIDAGRLTATSPAVTLTLGSLSIGANTLTISSATGSTAGFGAVTLTGNATLNTTTANASAGIVSGAFNLTKTGSGVLTLSGASTLTGATTISNGTLQFGAAGTSLSTSAVTVNSGAVLDLNSFSGSVGSLAGGGNVTLGSGTLEQGLDNSTTAYSGVMSGTGGLTKSGTGIFTLAGTNTYSGATTVNGGTFRIAAAERISDSSAVTVGAAGALDLNNFNETVASLAGSGAVTLGSGNLTVTGNSTNTTFSGVIGGSGGLTKLGSGTLVLSGPNTYTGATAVITGVLEIQNAAGLGDVAGGSTVSAGAEIRLNGDMDIGTEALSLSGSGFSGAGALHSVKGSITWAGNVTLPADATIGADAGVLTINGGISKGSNLLTFTGAGNLISAGVISGTGTSGITKSGTGTLSLNTANTYTGPTNVTTGVLSVQDPGALGAGGVGNGTVIASGAALEVTDDIGIQIGAEALTLDGDGIGSHGAFRSTSGDNIWGGAVTIASNTTIGVDADSLTLSSTFGESGSGRTLTKVGAGLLTLNGVASYTGATRINGGTLQIGATDRIYTGSAVTVAAGATFDLNDFNQTIGSLAGAGSVALGNTTGGILTLGGDNTSTAFSGGITGPGSLVKVGNGTLSLTGSNAFTGTFTLQAGTVAANTGAALGAGALLFNGGTLQSLNALTITLPATLQSGGGTVDTNGFTTGLSGVIDGSGNLTKIGAGTLSLAGANTYSGNTTISTGTIQLGNAAAIPFGAGKGNVNDSGTLDLNGYGGTVNGLSGSGIVTNGAATAATITVGGNDQSGVFGGTIQNGVGAVALTKTGVGVLTLNQANTYSGDTTISGGTIRLGNVAAIPSGTGKGNVIDNATLDLQGYSTTLNGLSGTGVVTNGLAGTATLTVGGNNQTSTFAGILRDGVGSLALEKSGTGTLALNGVNTYTGTTSVSAGVLSVQSPAALGAVGAASGTSIASGAALEVTNGAGFEVGAEALTLNGDGIASHGALRSVAGNNIWDGAVMLASNTTIGVDANSLTLLGGIGDAGGTRSLTKVGAGLLNLTGSATFTGATRINAGTLQIGASDRINDGSAITVAAGAVFDVNDFNETIGSLAGAGSVTLGHATGGALTTGADNSSTTFSGVISGAGSFVKLGSGSLTLTGANTFAGPFILQGGTVAVNARAALGAGSTFFNGGSLQSLNALTISTPATLQAGGGTVDTNGFATTLSGAIDGAGAFTKIGTGTLSLSGVNSYAGNTTLSAGTVQLGNAAAIPSGTGKGNVTVNGTLDLGGNSITVNGLSGAGVVTNSQGTAVTFTVGANDQSSVFSGIIQNGTGAVALTKTGAGALTLNQANTYTGTTTISSGTIQLGNAAALPSGTGKGNVVDNGTLDLQGFSTTLNALTGTGAVMNSVAGTATLTLGGTNLTSTFAGSLQDGAGALALVKSGTGTLALSGASTYSGQTGVNAGVLSVQNATALGAVGAGSGTSIATGAALELTDSVGFEVGAEALTLSGDGIASHGALRNVAGNSIWDGAVTFASNITIGVDANRLTLAGAIGDAGGARSLTKVGVGLLNLTGSASYTGATRINVGTLQLGASDRIYDGSVVAIAAGATFDLNDFNETIASLTGAGALTLGHSAGGTLAAGGDNTSTTFCGLITGPGSLAKAGSGTMTLTGANTFTGALVLQGGTVAVNTKAALGAGSLVFNGGILQPLSAMSITIPVTLQTGGGTVNTNGFATSLSGAIAGPGSLTKIGAGTLSLAGVNSYSGDTTISLGTLRLCNAAALPSGTGRGNLIDNGTLDLNGNSGTVNGLSGSGIVTNAAATAATFTVGANDQSSTFDGVIQNGLGAIALTKIGAGMLTLNQANTYSGTTTISGGTLQLGNLSAIPSGTGKGNVADNGTLDLQGFSAVLNGFSGTGVVTNSFAGSAVLNLGGNNQSSAFSGTIRDGAGSIALVKSGTGTLTLGNANSYSGSTGVRGGVLAIGADASLGAAPIIYTPGSLTLDGATLSVLSSMTLASTRGVTIGPSLGSGTGTLNIASGASVTYGGVIADNGSGVGSLVVQGGGSFELDGASTYSGNTVVSSGTLVSGNIGALPSGAGKGDFVDNGYLDLNGYGATVNGISGSGRVTNNRGSSSATLTAGAGDRSSAFGGTIENGAGVTALNKIGTGTLTLTGANTYSGNTTISAGTLAVSGSLTATSSVAVSANSTLYLTNGTVNTLSTTTVSGTLSGAGTLGNLTINNGGVLAPGGASTGILNVGSLTLSSGAMVNMDIGGEMAGASYDQIHTTGTITLGGSNLQLTLTNGFRPVSGSRYLLVSNGNSGSVNIGNFNGLANNARITLTNDQGSYAFNLRYADYDGNGTNDVFLALADTKKQLSWSNTGANPLQGTLNPALIPTNSAATGVRYTNVNGQGYVVVVITKSLTQDGGGAYNGTPAWWFAGGTAASGGKTIPYSTVTFRFYKTGTTTPIGLTGIQTTFQDAEDGERFRAFGYWNAGGTSVASSFTDSQIFTYSNGLVVHSSDSSVDNGAVQAPGTQDGKWIGLDLSLNAISGFTFQTGRYNPSSGSVLMTGLGLDLALTTELSIKSGTVANVSAGPNFVAGSDNATLTPAAITSALATGAVSITSGVSQNIVVNENIASGAGNGLSLRATQNLLTASGISLSLASTTRSASALTLSADGTVRTGHLDTSSTAGSGGALVVTAGTAITICNGIDTSSNQAGSPGGAVSLQAFGSITVDTIRSGGGGSMTRAGSPGDIVVTAGTSIVVKSIYADSLSGAAVRTTLTAPSITLGTAGGIAADVEGSLYLQKPTATAAATIAINGTIQGATNLVIDAGTGVASLNSRADHTGQTHLVSGTLAMNGNSMAASDLFLEGSSTLAPNISTPGGYAAVKSLTIGTGATFGALLTSATTSDQLRMSGSANLDGTFKLTLASGYVPAIGTPFSIMNFGSATGAFRSYQGLRLSDRVLVPVFSGTSMSLLTSAIASGASQPLQVVPAGGLNLSSGDNYDGLTTSGDGTGILRKATIIGGVASWNTTVTMSLASDATGFNTAPDVNATTLHLHGTGTDKFVLQLDYDEAAVRAAGLDESQLALAWANSSGQFVNAVAGNTDLPGEANAPQQFVGAYDAQSEFHLGYYGVDTVNDRIWAVLDHNSTYGFTDSKLVVPEPATAVSLLGGLAILGLRRRRPTR